MAARSGWRVEGTRGDVAGNAAAVHGKRTTAAPRRRCAAGHPALLELRHVPAAYAAIIARAGRVRVGARMFDHVENHAATSSAVCEPGMVREVRSAADRVDAELRRDDAGETVLTMHARMRSATRPRAGTR